MVVISVKPPMPCGLELEAWSLRLRLYREVALRRGRLISQ